MSKRDDKHDLAEDYLAQIKWRGEHPYSKARPPEPDWKYKPVYSKIPSRPQIQFGLFFLFALIVVAALAIFQLITTSRVDAAWLIVIMVLLGFILFITRKSK